MDDDADWLSAADEPEPEPTPAAAPAAKGAAPAPAAAGEAPAAAEAPAEAEAEAADEYLDPDKLLLFKHWIRWDEMKRVWIEMFCIFRAKNNVLWNDLTHHRV